MSHSLRRLLPNLVTFAGLACAFSAVLAAVEGVFTVAGVCILAGYLLDAVDGALARRLGVTSPFGLQLDSLVDLVTFGVASALLLYQYLHLLGTSRLVMWIVCTVYVAAGAFRLARFNLLPPKRSGGHSLGLTISTSGAMLALAVLTNQEYGQRLIPAAAFPVLMIVLALLMVSRIRYPELGSILLRRKLSLAGLSGAAVLAIWLSPQLVWLGITTAYLSLGLVRAVYGLVQ